MPRWVGGLAMVPVRAGLRKSLGGCGASDPFPTCRVEHPQRPGLSARACRSLRAAYSRHSIASRSRSCCDHHDNRGAAVVAEMIKAALRHTS